MDLLHGATLLAGSFLPAEWAITHTIITILVGLLLLALVASYIDRRRDRNELLKLSGWVPRRKGKALTRQRSKFVDGLVISDFIEMLQYRVYQRQITDEEARLRLLRLAKVFPKAKELHPAVGELKKTIEHRLGTHTKANIPGDKPPPVKEAAPNVVPFVRSKGTQVWGVKKSA